MKIRHKLTIRYAAVTATIFLLLLSMIYLFSENNRKMLFYRTLSKEGITKAHLFLKHKMEAETMQSIYSNNINYIDEVEVALYDTAFNLLYHDAVDIDLVKETPEMLQKILTNEYIEFFEGKYQVVGLRYPFAGKDYILTAAAYDGYGYEKLAALQHILIFSGLISLAVLALIGYMMSRTVLSPVTNIVKQVEQITASNLDARVPVTDRHDELGELATTFNNTLDRLENSFDAQKMFVSNVSHELRTPMAALIGCLELSLLKERTPEEYRRSILEALDDGKRIVKLAEGLLNLAKASYIPEQIKKEEVRLDELLLDAREQVLKGNPDYIINLLFEQETDDDSMITVMGNLFLLNIAFVNLMENNCKFSEDKTSNVHISFYEEKSILRFSDTGVGMSEEDKANLFIPFYRGSNRSYTQGNGIGMALVDKIVRIHKGAIHVHSCEGEGTVFTVEFSHI